MYEKLVETYGNLHSYSLDGRHLARDLSEMKKKGYKNIVINPSWHWVKGKPIDFLYNENWIEGVELVGDDYDITPVNCLKNLKLLRLDSSEIQGSIDFKNFPDLKYLIVAWKKGRFLNIEAASICRLVRILKYPFENLLMFKEFSELRDIEINYSKLESFLGLEECLKLKKIEINSAPRLKSIALSDRVAEKLASFSLEKCKSIEDYTVLEKMKSLETIYLFEAAPVHSVDFLRKMAKLRYAYIGVDIVDKNVSFLKERGFEFKNARLYK